MGGSTNLFWCGQGFVALKLGDSFGRLLKLGLFCSFGGLVIVICLPSANLPVAVTLVVAFSLVVATFAVVMARL